MFFLLKNIDYTFGELQFTRETNFKKFKILKNADFATAKINDLF